MFGSVIGQVTGQLDRRFLLNGFFPVLVFALALGLAVAAGADGVDTEVARWTDASTETKVLLSIGAAAGLLVAANIVANGTLWIIQLYEGYVAPAKWLAGWGRARQHRKGHDQLAEDPIAFQRTFPVVPRTLERKHFAPTRLGNLLRSAESYSMDRYGVAAVQVWPRLFHLLPENLRTSMAEARSSMEFLLVISFLASLYSVFAGIYLVVAGGPLAWLLTAIVAGPLVAYVGYAAALAPASVYGDHIRASFDLHRFALLEALRAPRPATLAEERRTWQQIVSQLDDATDTIWRYVGPSE